MFDEPTSKRMSVLHLAADIAPRQLGATGHHDMPAEHADAWLDAREETPRAASIHPEDPEYWYRAAADRPAAQCEEVALLTFFRPYGK